LPQVDPTPAPTATPVPVVVIPDPTPVVVAPTPVPVVVAPTPVPVVVAPTPAPVVVVPTPAPVVVSPSDCQTAGVSTKACYLAKIMEMGCPLRDHVPANYVAPSGKRILGSLDQCTESAYPTTAATAEEMNVIQALINPNDASFRTTIFTGLYFKPPYTDEFAKYFGIELYNAIYMYCDNYYALPGSGSMHAGPSDSYKSAQQWVDANKFAGQLKECSTASLYTK
jgi:hypothetical protein